MAENPAGDPSPRTLESLALGLKSLEEKLNVRFEAYDEAVKLLQEFANRQPTTEAVHVSLSALDRLTEARFVAVEKLVDTKFDGNKTALDAALKTQKEASDEIKVSFGKQFDNQAKTIDDLKDRINTGEGRGLGSRDLIAMIVAIVVIVGGIAALLATRT